MADDYPKSDVADIMLILEGTYPFVTGGVSSWLHQLLINLPQYRFAIIFLGGQQSDYGGFRYKLPNNVVHLEAHYLFNYESDTEDFGDNKYKESFAQLQGMHDKFRTCKYADYGQFSVDLKKELFSTDDITLKDFLHHYSSWEYLFQTYLTRCPDISFLDYFWTIRNLHIPIWLIVDIAKSVPTSRIIHSASTGYAGFLAALIHLERNYPFILTEHGLYVKERKIELLNQWIGAGGLLDLRSMETKQYLTNLWIQFFEVLAKICYSAADPIISLFDHYREQQIKAGASQAKTIVVPNGIKIIETETKSSPSSSPIIAIIGRVVPIKDIKTFIRAMVIVIKKIPLATALIVGSTDEDEKYAAECRELINILNLNNCITLTGVQKVNELLPAIDLLAITSISEGLPLVLLEAFAFGIAAVTTDVGACRELLYGNTDEDKALGESGIVVEIANTNAIAEAIIDLLTHDDKRQAAAKTAKERVKRFYNEKQLLQRYTDIYDKAIASWQA